MRKTPILLYIILYISVTGTGACYALRPASIISSEQTDIGAIEKLMANKAGESMPVFSGFSHTMVMPARGKRLGLHEDTIREIVAKDEEKTSDGKAFRNKAEEAWAQVKELDYRQAKQKTSQEAWLKPFTGKLRLRHFKELVNGWRLNPNFIEAVKLIKSRKGLHKQDILKINMVTGTITQAAEAFITTNKEIEVIKILPEKPEDKGVIRIIARVHEEVVQFNITGVSLIMDDNGYYTGYIEEVDASVIYGAKSYPKQCVIIGDSFMRVSDEKGTGFGARLIDVNGKFYSRSWTTHVLNLLLAPREEIWHLVRAVPHHSPAIPKQIQSAA